MDDFQRFILSLEKGLKQPLPGLEAQLRMAGLRRIIREGRMEAPDDARKAAVLVLFYPSGPDVMLVFMKRNEYPGVHSGQVSFPGGGMEPQDPDMEQTALRETQEELGVRASTVRVIGRLSELYIPPSNFLVTPVVGYATKRPEFRPDPGEVAGIIEVRLSDLLRSGTIQQKEIELFPSARMEVPCFFVNDTVIWGATAMMLSELIAVVRELS